MTATVAATHWYSRNYPDAARLLTTGQWRCIGLLEEWRPLYNIYRAGEHRPDGGFRKCGTGIKVLLRAHTIRLSTHDTAELTHLVLLAHKHRCRVEIGPGRGFGIMEIIVHPRTDTYGHSWEWHPGLNDLVQKSLTMAEVPALPS